MYALYEKELHCNFGCDNHRIVSLRNKSILFNCLLYTSQFYTRGLLDMGVGVYQHICRSVSGGSLNSLHIAAGDHQLIGGTGMAVSYTHLDVYKRQDTSRVDIVRF